MIPVFPTDIVHAEQLTMARRQLLQLKMIVYLLWNTQRCYVQDFTEGAHYYIYNTGGLAVHTLHDTWLGGCNQDFLGLYLIFPVFCFILVNANMYIYTHNHCHWNKINNDCTECHRNLIMVCVQLTEQCRSTQHPVFDWLVSRQVDREDIVCRVTSSG